jgi:hypothetical protein
VRAGLLQDRDVYLIAVMLRTPDGELYETWFNYWQTGGGREYLEDWSRQKSLALLFYGDRGTRERQILIVNPLADLAGQALPVLEATTPWSMANFDAAKARICEAYPDLAALWEALAG